jgi:hypothetical protein
MDSRSLARNRPGLHHHAAPRSARQARASRLRLGRTGWRADSGAAGRPRSEGRSSLLLQDRDRIKDQDRRRSERKSPHCRSPTPVLARSPPAIQHRLVTVRSKRRNPGSGSDIAQRARPPLLDLGQSRRPKPTFKRRRVVRARPGQAGCVVGHRAALAQAAGVASLGMLRANDPAQGGHRRPPFEAERSCC